MFGIGVLAASPITDHHLVLDHDVTISVLDNVKALSWFFDANYLSSFDLLVYFGHVFVSIFDLSLLWNSKKVFIKIIRR